MWWFSIVAERPNHSKGRPGQMCEGSNSRTAPWIAQCQTHAVHLSKVNSYSRCGDGN